MLAVELRPEETGRSFQYLVGALEFSVLLLKLFDPDRLHDGHTRRVPVILCKVLVGLLTGLSRRSMTCALFLGEGIPTSVATDVPS